MKKFHSKVLILVLAMIPSFISASHAQTRTVTGTVIEQTSDGSVPIPGAAIYIKGVTGQGTSSSSDGKFSITIPDNDKTTLVFSCIGYRDVEIPVQRKNVIDVIMETASEMLDELVVVGYGVQRRSDVAGSVTSVKAEELSTYPATNISEMMRGKAAGVQVSLSSGAPGSSSSIQIRGVRSILDGSNTPMFVVDGIPATETEFNSISPSEVESLEILKDAASQAIYGARAANGVILVTTKRGKDEQATITFDTSIASQHLWRNFDFYSPQEYFELRRHAQANDAGIDDPAIIAELTPESVFMDEMMQKAYEDGRHTDWESLMFSPAIKQTYQLGVRGGNKKIKFSANAGYLDHKGMIKTDSRFRRGTIRVNADYDANKWLSLGVSSSYIKQSNLSAPGSFNSYITRSPFGMAYDEDGNINEYINSSGDTNPLYNAQYQKSQTDTDITRLNGFLDIHPIKGLSYRLNLGYYNRYQESGSYRKKEYTGGGAAGSIESSKLFRYTIENILNYQVPIPDKDHSLNLTAVQSYEHQVSSGIGFGADTVPVDQFWWNMIADGVNTSMSRSVSEYYILSYLARAQYNYKGRYIINAAVRADGSSRFGKNSKWGYFPSVSAAWRISQEKWMKNVSWVSNLKLRASYGMVGNQNGIGNYETLGTAVDYKYEFGDNYYIGYLPGNTLPNQDLAWESTASANIAVDFGFFKNRLNGTVEYYNTRTTNLLFKREINGVLGYTSITDNVAQTATSGFDINLNGDIIRKKNFNWNMGMVFSTFDNRIVRLSGAVDEKGVPVNDVANGWFIGEPINVYYDYKTDGIYQYDDFVGQDIDGKWILPNTYDTDGDGNPDAPLRRDDVIAPGKIKVVDKNNDGVINQNDRYVIKRDPDFIMSLNTTFSFYGVDIFMDWYGVYGAVRKNTYLSDPNSGGSLQGKNNGVKVNYWTPDNPSNEWPRPSFNSNTTYQSSLTITDASYIRLRTLSVGYNLPKKALKAIRFKGIKVALTATNLLTFTKYLSYSPETSVGAYPEPRQYAVSLNLTF